MRSQTVRRTTHGTDSSVRDICSAPDCGSAGCFLSGSRINATLLYLDIPTIVAFQRMSAGVDVFALLAIPFFIYAGELINQSGIAVRLVRFAESLLGRLKGGLGHVSVFACMMFGAVSGSAVASTSAMGSALVPIMRDKGYDDDFAVNVTATASTTGC